MQNWRDEQLLADRGAPQESFSVFYRRHFAGVMRASAFRGLAAEEAADVAAETFATALLQRYRYRPRHPSAAPWLLTIASNKAADAHRFAAREGRARRRLAMEPVQITEEDRRGYDQLLRSAAEALASLPETQQESVRARVCRGQSYASISRSCGVTESTARQHVSRGLARLRQQLSVPRTEDKS